jgi:DNA polymerase III delta prime subunit
MKKIKILSIESLEDKHHVYDLTVEGNHNFFIGETQTLTHNCDFLTPASQAALRNLMETFSLTTRFILTCNYYERIIDPVVSRCQVFQVSPPSKRDVAIHLAKISQRKIFLSTKNISR